MERPKVWAQGGLVNRRGPWRDLRSGLRGGWLTGGSMERPKVWAQGGLVNWREPWRDLRSGLRGDWLTGGNHGET